MPHDSPSRQHDEDEEDQAPGQPLTREQWLAFHVARAPKISRRQWADTLLLLRMRNRHDDDSPGEKEAS